MDGASGLMATGAAALATSLAIAVAFAGATLLVRRLSGGFAAAASAAVPWVVTLAGVPLVFAVEAAARLGGDWRPVWFARGGLVAAALAVAPLAATVAWPTRAVGLVGTAVALVAALRPAAGWRPPRLGSLRPASRGNVAALSPLAEDGGRVRDESRGDSGRSSHSPTRAAPQPLVANWSAALPSGFRQRLERFETPQGEECVQGQVMLSVAAGSRTGHAHVGFCPSFVTLPSVEVASDCDFVEAEVTAAEILPWGVRVECRLSEPAEEPLEIPVAIRAIRSA